MKSERGITPREQRVEGIRLEGGGNYVKEISRVFRRVLCRVCTLREVVMEVNAV